MKSQVLNIKEFYLQNPHLVLSPFTSEFGLTFLSPILLRNLIGPMCGMRVVDCGCGSGSIFEVLDNLGINEYIGVDLLGNQFIKGNRKIFVEEDIHNIKFALDKYGEFDCALLLDVVEHLRDPKTAIRNIFEILKPNGYLFCSSPNYLNTAGLFKILIEGSGLCPRNTWAPFGGWQKQEHESHMTSIKLRKLLMENGFEITHHLGMDIISGLCPIFFGKQDIWLKGFTRDIYNIINKYMFIKAQYLCKWISMYTIIVAHKPK